MEIRSLGRSGLKVSAIAFGCNNFGMILDAAGSQRVVHKALDLGITFFDVADFYGGPVKGNGEIFLGKALGNRRHDVVIATKFGVPMGADWTLRGGGSRDYIIHAVEASLRRLGTDYIDLYQFHLPDPTTPIEETLRALDHLVRQGKIRYIGQANSAAWQIGDAVWTAKLHDLIPFVSTQYPYSVLSRDIEREIVPVCHAHGLGILPYAALESGILTGKFTSASNPPPDSRIGIWSAHRGTEALAAQFLTEEFVTAAAALDKVAAETGGTVLELALGWLASRPGVTSLLIGASKPEQLEANVKAAAWRPTTEQLKRIDEISPPPKRGPYGEVLPNDLRKRGYLIT